MNGFREEIIGDARLILGDCREMLDCWPEVDHVITDPPYSANTHEMMRTNKQGRAKNGARRLAREAAAKIAEEKR